MGLCGLKVGLDTREFAAGQKAESRLRLKPLRNSGNQQHYYLPATLVFAHACLLLDVLLLHVLSNQPM